MVIATSGEPTSLNPYIAAGSGDTPVISNIYDLPVYLSLDGEIIPGLAESWNVSEDGLTYTFNLAKNAKWHDGKPVTSADLVFTFKECLGQHPKGGWWKKIPASYQTPDERTMVMKLQKPFPSFLRNIAVEGGGAMVLPKHLYEGTDLKKSPYNRKPVGTGPFMFKEWVRGSHIELVRNPNYYGKGKENRPYADRLVVRFIPDAGGRMLALKAGEVDFLPASFVSLEEIAKLRKDPKITVDGRRAIGSIKYLLFNLRHPTLAKKEVRQAIAYGVDKKKIIDFALAGEAEVAKSFIIRDMAWAFNPKVPDYSYDPQKANELLDKAGFAKGPDGVRFKLRLSMSGRGGDQQIAEIVRDNLRQMGIDLQIIPSDLATFYDTVFQRWDFDVALQQMASGNDPTMGCTRFLHSKNIKKARSSNVMGYSDPEVDKLLDAEATQPDQKKRAAAWFRIQEIVMGDLPLIPLHRIPTLNVYRSEWADMVTKGDSSGQSREDAYMKK